jgi:hypothetical protein
MQTKDELEDWYKIPDQWQYFKLEDDEIRKQKILGMLDQDYNNALDIGCGECFLTRHLPAKQIYGIELSDIASSRFPPNVTRLKQPECDTTYDLVISTGTMYQQYDHNLMYGYIIEAASKHILIAGMKEWIIPKNYGTIINQIEFPYRGLTQIVTLYQAHG